jgi:hypothetical protein
MDKISRVRCGTKRCAGFVDTNLAKTLKSRDGNWQFQCSSCQFWNVVSKAGTVTGTSRDAFDLDSLPNNLRLGYPVKREPPGGI